MLVTPAEKTRIREAAGNVPLSAYMRGKLLGTPDWTPKKPAGNPVAGTPETSLFVNPDAELALGEAGLIGELRRYFPMSHDKPRRRPRNPNENHR